MKKTHGIAVRSELDERLLNHKFCYDENFSTHYRTAKMVADHYAKAENAVAVLSNMPWDTSYICYGHLGELLGIGKGCEEVASIWEKKLMERIHLEDLTDKIAWELQFHTFVDKLPMEQKSDYYLQHFLRLKDDQGNYMTIRHRIFYLDYDEQNNVRLTLCLYTAARQNTSVTGIIHSIEDTLVNDTTLCMQGLLSAREREVLEQISQGKASKQIADALFISTNTVNNHRQHIMRKLHCQNTAEAVVVASKLGIIHTK